MPSLISIAEVRALTETDLPDADLQGVIDRDEAWLASRIGVLTGSRIHTFHVYGADRPLILPRPTATATVTDNGITRVVRVISGGWRIESTYGSWAGPILATFTPNDEALVKRVLHELVRGSLASSPYTAERWGEVSYSKGDVPAQEAAREALAASLQRPRGVASVRIRSSLESSRVGATL